MRACLDQWETPALTKEMNDIIEEYDALFAEYEALGGDDPDSFRVMLI